MQSFTTPECANIKHTVMVLDESPGWQRWRSPWVGHQGWVVGGLLVGLRKVGWKGGVWVSHWGDVFPRIGNSKLFFLTKKRQCVRWQHVKKLMLRPLRFVALGACFCLARDTEYLQWKKTELRCYRATALPRKAELRHRSRTRWIPGFQEPGVGLRYSIQQQIF